MYATAYGVPQFKLVLCGDRRVGTEDILDLHTPAENSGRRHIASLGVDLAPLLFFTNRGPIQFNVWDTAGHDLRDLYMQAQAHCAIIMFDVTSRVTYKNVPNWHRDLTQIWRNIPIVLVGNKVRLTGRNTKPSQITFHRKKNLQYYDISTKLNYNLEKPFLWLARKLSGDNQLHFIDMPVFQSPEVIIKENATRQYEQEIAQAMLLLANAAAHPLPEEDDEGL